MNPTFNTGHIALLVRETLKSTQEYEDSDYTVVIAVVH